MDEIALAAAKRELLEEVHRLRQILPADVSRLTRTIESVLTSAHEEPQDRVEMLEMLQTRIDEVLLHFTELTALAAQARSLHEQEVLLKP